MDQELIAYLDRHFRESALQIEALREEMSHRFEQLELRVEKLEATGRQTLVMVEGLRSDIRLVAEGLMGLSDRLEKHIAEVDSKLGDVKASIAPAYRALEEKVERKTIEMSQRVVVLEERAARETRDILTVIREKYGRPQAV